MYKNYFMPMAQFVVCCPRPWPGQVRQVMHPGQSSTRFCGDCYAAYLLFFLLACYEHVWSAAANCWRGSVWVCTVNQNELFRFWHRTGHHFRHTKGNTIIRFFLMYTELHNPHVAIPVCGR